MKDNTSIFIKKSKNVVIKIDIASIIYCEANGKETMVYSEHTEPINLPLMLKQIEQKFLEYNFIRISRKHLVNLDNCKIIQTKPTPIIILNNNIELKISRRNVNFLLNKCK